MTKFHAVRVDAAGQLNSMLCLIKESEICLVAMAWVCLGGKASQWMLGTLT
jgi:hypothetical protein